MKQFRNRMGTFVVTAALVMGGVAPVVLAQTAGQDVKDAGHDTKDAAKDTGHGVAKGTKAVAHGTKKGTNKAYDSTKDAAKDTGHDVQRAPRRSVHKSANATSKTADKAAGQDTNTPVVGQWITGNSGARPFRSRAFLLLVDSIGEIDAAAMEARVGQLLQHKVRDVGARDAAAAGGQRIRQHAIGPGCPIIGQARRPHDGVVEIACGEQAFLRALICHGMTQQRRARNRQRAR